MPVLYTNSVVVVVVDEIVHKLSRKEEDIRTTAVFGGS